MTTQTNNLLKIDKDIDREKLEQQALFNLDFEDYKKQVYIEKQKKERDLEKNPPKFKFNDDNCYNNNDISNAYLITGLLMIIFAIIMMLIA
jgi:hypothetical protein